jgi:glycosyltransferase involved in cell wall biosynthesis
MWVVSTHATDGYPAITTNRPYACWIGTSLAAESRGRLLPRIHRTAANASNATLRRLERKILRGASVVYATSPSSLNELAVASDRDDVRLLPIPVDVDRFVPADSQSWRNTFRHPVLVFVGRSDDPRKNVALLLELARLLPDVRVVLVGAPPRGPVPANVEVRGRVDDVASVLREATLFVLPSRQEGFGIVAAEALSAGLPVITTPSGGPESLIRLSGGGVVTETFEARDVAAAAEGLLGRPDEMATMRQRGRAYVAREHSPATFRRALSAAFAEESP